MSALKYNKTVYKISGNFLTIHKQFNSENEARKFASETLKLKTDQYNVLPETIVCR